MDERSRDGESQQVEHDDDLPSAQAQRTARATKQQQKSSNHLTSRASASAETMGAAQRRAAATAVKRWSFILEVPGARVVNCAAIAFRQCSGDGSRMKWFQGVFLSRLGVRASQRNACPFQKVASVLIPKYL